MRSRVLTAFAAGIPVLAAASRPEAWPFAVLLGLVAAAACWELFSLLRVPGAPIAGACLGALTTAAGLSPEGARSLPAATWLALGVAAQTVGVLALSGRRGLRMGPGTPEAALGGLWILSPLSAALLLHAAGAREAEGWHFGPIWMLLLPVWLGDSAAMLVGRRWGRRRMAPTLSPGKTWEGASANLVAATLGGVAAAACAGLPTAVGALCGLGCGVFGQAGDLFESWIKRRANVKDSGFLLPGHGGVLDRIDALLFSAWPVAFVLWAWGLPGL
ncbi:MAG: phosphatidate cytidylyltransferase [Fimbriimonadales bacterium]|nr:phosphatidate cytidylyltransferase [Fimbriimonadales bacterium]